MKLKHKLIPTLAVASTIAAVTPFSLSACSNDSLKMTDLLNMKTPTFYKYQPTDSKYLEPAAATQLYVDFMESNPNNSVIDMKWGIYQNWLSAFDNSNYAYIPTIGSKSKYFEIYNAQMNKLNVGVTPLKFGEVAINVPGKGTETYHTLSFKMSIEAEIDVKTTYGLDRSKTTTHKIKVSSTAEYRNMLFFAYAATRNDKTHGNSKDPSEMPVDTTKGGWWITISEDSEVQYNYRRNYSDWGIDYTFDFDDVITDHDDVTKKDIVTHKTAKYGSTIDTYVELENLIGLKTFGYKENVPLEEQDEAWRNWFTQDANSILANCILLDNVSYYLSDCHSSPYMYVPEGLSAESELGENEYLLNGTLFYPDDTFELSEKDNYKVYLRTFKDKEEVTQITLNEPISHAKAGSPISLTIDGNKTEITNCIDWETWALTKGAAPIQIPVELSREIDQDDLDAAGDFQYVLGSKNSLQFVIKNIKTGEEYAADIKLNDALGLITLTK